MSQNLIRHTAGTSEESGAHENTQAQTESLVPIDSDLIEAGAVSFDNNEDVQTFNKEAHEADTARFLGKFVVRALAVYLVLHYIVVGIASVFGAIDVLTHLEDVFNSALPVLAGLAGSAVTYFLTRRNE